MIGSVVGFPARKAKAVRRSFATNKEVVLGIRTGD